MTLLDLITTIERAAARQPAVRTIVRQDATRLNALPDADYGVFAWVCEGGELSQIGSLATYTFVLFYIDRLTPDKRNLEGAQSTGVSVIGNIVNALLADGVFVGGTYAVTPFAHRFADECAGAFARVAFTVEGEGVCAEDFEEKQVKIY